jgi:Protein of unknown function (DUF3563)
MRSMLVEPADAAMAVVSRYVNFALSEQIQHAHGAAVQTRDYAREAAAVAATELPAGPARTALLATLARHEAEAEALMRDVLRFAREHGHLAFAFPVNRWREVVGAHDNLENDMKFFGCLSRLAESMERLIERGQRQADEAYLARSADHVDLELRLREIERAHVFIPHYCWLERVKGIEPSS